MSDKKSALPIDGLDAKTQKQLNKILSKSPEALTNEEKEFLYGRRDYLTADQKDDFGVSEPVWRDEAEADDEAGEPSKVRIAGDNAKQVVEHKVTKKDLKDNPDWVKQGIKKGDIVEIEPEA